MPVKQANHRLLAIAVMAFAVYGNLARATAPVGSVPGYLDSIDDERHEKSDELVVVSEPKPLPGTKPFVSDELSKEFQRQYELKFGYTGAEQGLLPSRDGDYFYNGVTVSYQDDLSHKHDFGNYMVRRVAEYHLDNYMKGNDTLRPVYEVKDKLSNVDVKVSDNYKVTTKYSISGNYVETKVENPYHVDTKLQTYLSNGETIATMGYQATPKVNVLSDYRLESSVMRFVASRQITPALSTNLTYETYLSGNEGDSTIDGIVKQRMLLVGLTYRN